MSALLIDARTCADCQATYSEASNAFFLIITAAIVAALQAGKRTASVSLSSKAGVDVLNARNVLQSKGFSTNQIGTNLVIQW